LEEFEGLNSGEGAKGVFPRDEPDLIGGIRDYFCTESKARKVLPKGREVVKGTRIVFDQFTMVGSYSPVESIYGKANRER